jgi:hypothetical protein
VREVEPFLQRLGRPYRILSDASAAAECGATIALPAPPDPVFAPLVYAAALALYAAWLSAELGAEYGRGARGRWQDCRDGATTRNSERLPAAEPAAGD